MTALPDQSAVLHFWFKEIQPAQWWSVDPAFDETIRSRFHALHRAAVQGELFGWRSSPDGRLAEIIILDQFSRNLYRNCALAFAADPMALALAQEAVSGGYDSDLPAGKRLFLYMPFMHSESAVIHVTAEKLFRSLKLPRNLDYELRHKAIIDRFGRYPHRNESFGRPSTEEELRFLQEPGSRF